MMNQEFLQSEETVFGHDGVGGGGADQYEDGGLVMSDRVQAVATNVYREFERMIPAYGEDVVKEMMPHIVTILENLDIAFKENQEKEAELELCKDDNEQLMTQYEREKQLRKSADQKLMAIEDMIDDERKEVNGKIESLQSIVRTFELKAKNAHDHITRLEEKELELKKEYSKLHDRYTELLKKHMDHVEKSKMLMGADRMFELGGVSPRKGQGLQMPVLRPVGVHLADSGKVGYEVGKTGTTFPLAHPEGNVDLEQELSHVGRPAKGRTAEKDIITDSIDVKERGTATSSAMTPEELDVDVRASPRRIPGRQAPASNMSSIFDELLDSDALAEVDDGADITAVSDNFFGMSKEVENLILENTELLATKNALNVVKDDLIAKVDELTSEQEILREEMESCRLMKEKMKSRVAELEDEVRKFREAHELEKQKISMEDEDELPMAQRKRFTRVEMARVLMERNQYKERLMELQEAVRWTEMIRASREHPDLLPGSHSAKKKSSIWNFFSNLFNSSSNKHPRKIASMPTVRYNAPTTQNRSAESSPRKEKQKLSEIKKTDFLQDEMLTEKKRKEQEQERKEQYKQLRAHVKKEDGRMQAYGWSVPAKCSTSVPKDSQAAKTKGQMPVPVPVFCRPMSDVDTNMKVWCAAGVSLSSSAQSEQTGSIVWICTTSPSGSQVTVVDATNPGSPLDKFPISHAHVLCIACVPGLSQTSHSEENGQSSVDAGELSSSAGAEEPIEKNEDTVSRDNSCDGRVAVVKCRRYRESVDMESATDLPADEKEEVKIFQTTFWLGAQNGCIYLYSAVNNWDESLYAVKLPDAVLSINTVKNQVFVALANGSVGIFCRSEDGSWDLTKYFLITLGKPQHSIRCTCVVDDEFVWCGYRNKVHIVNPAKLALEKTFDVHPRKESQIRQMVWVSEGVWISIRLDSTLRLYHATTHQHLQDVDIEPYVSKMLGTGKLGFSFVRITSLMAACNRLWIGTGNGVIICVPLSESNKIPITAAIPGRPGGVIRVYRESPTEPKDVPTGSGYIPYCSMAQAQLSFHGHRDAVKFFVVIPAGGNQHLSNALADNTANGKTSIDGNANEMMLVMSGGEGYIDFRVGATNTGDTDEETEGAEDQVKTDAGQGKTYLSHLIVWQVYQNS